TLRSEALSNRSSKYTSSPCKDGQRPSFSGSKQVCGAVATAGSSSGTRSITLGGLSFAFNRASRKPCRPRHSKHAIPKACRLHPGSHRCTTAEVGNTPDFQRSSKNGIKRSIGSLLFRGKFDPNAVWIRAACASKVILFPP